MIAVLLHFFVSSIIILKSIKSKYKMIFFLAYVARIFILFFDLFCREIYVLHISGLDSEMFYNTSILISNDLSMLGNTRGDPYADIMGVFFFLIGPQRIIGKYFNVLLGIYILFVISKTLKLLNTNSNVSMTVLIIAAFPPNSLTMSGIFLHEIFPTFFVATSLYYFIKWFKFSKFKHIILSFTMLDFASIFHSGVIGIAWRYVFVFLFYRKKTINLNLV